MNEERIREIEALIDAADLPAIWSAVDNDGDCYESEREFTDNAAEHMRALIAEVRSLRAKLDAVPDYVDYRRGYTDWDTGAFSFDEWCERFLEVQP
jgi:hypothetical protein